MGCRNPWRMSVDQATGFVYWGEVGPDAGGDGPRGYDEINQARRAGNFGWPYFVGNNQAYFDYDYETMKVGTVFDVNAPINESPNNTGEKLLPPAQPALVWYPGAASNEFPELGSVDERPARGRSITSRTISSPRPSSRRDSTACCSSMNGVVTGSNSSISMTTFR